MNLKRMRNIMTGKHQGRQWNAIAIRTCSEKQILNTPFAATFYSSEIKSEITSNARDFELFKVFAEILTSN